MAYIAVGADAGKLAVIIDVVDQNRVCNYFIQVCVIIQKQVS